MKHLVNLIIAGTQKGGTTALCSYLRTHPQIYIARRKEIHFFDNEELFETSDVDYSVYHAYFRPKPSHCCIGEATPIYMYWQDAPKRIWQYNPKIKIILILRNPIERAFSHWNMERRLNNEELSFWDAIQQEQERCKDALPLQHRLFSYTDRGFYTEQLRRIWRYFPKNQTLVLRNEDLRHKPDKTLHALCRFLDLPVAPKINAKNVHSQLYIRPMSTHEKDYLKHIYEYEIKCLERLLDWDCSNWLD